MFGIGYRISTLGGGGGADNGASPVPEGAIGIYSTHRIIMNYYGAALRVRRSSDDAEQDIYFSNDVVNETALTDFCGVGDGYVVKWYDQSGLTNDFEQPNPLYQPKIVSSGVVITDNSLPGLDFLPSGDGVHLLSPSGFLNGATELSFFGVWNIVTASNDGVFGASNTNSVGLEILTVNVSSRPTFLRINGTLRNDNAGAAYQMWNASTQSLTTIIGNATDVKVYKDGSAVTLTDSSALPALNFNGQYAMGLYNDLGNSMEGKIQCVIVYDTDQTAERANIEGYLITHFGI